MKYLIVGLGNVGTEYTYTRHNIGFEVVDVLAEEFGATFSLGRLAHTTTIKHKGRTLIVIKPTTFMNLSGKAVQYWLQQENIPVANVLVVTDDISLPISKLRLRSKGSDGGHNGLKSIQAVLNTAEYARLRFGVGNDFAPGQQANYVLGKWKETDVEPLNKGILQSVDIIKSFVSIGLPLTMNQFNGK